MLPLLVGIYACISVQLLSLFVLSGALGAIILGYVRRPFVQKNLLYVAITCAVFFAWAVASAIWSLDSSTTLRWVTTDAAIAIAGLCLLVAATRANENERLWARRGALLGWALAWLALSSQYLSDTPFLVFHGAMPRDPAAWPTALNNQAVFVALLAWPAGQALAARGAWLRLIPPVLSLATLTQGASAAAFAALAISLTASFLAKWLTRSILIVMGAIVVFAIGGLPDLVRTVDGGVVARALPQSVEFSAFHRFEIWRFASEKIAERPLTGWGARVADRIPNAHAGISVDSPRAAKLRRPPSGHAPNIPKHPHNAALQARLDLGLIGALLAQVFLIAILLVLPRAWPNSATPLGLAATALVVSQVSYDLWQDWWHAALWLTAAFVAVGAPGSRPQTEDVRGRNSGSVR